MASHVFDYERPALPDPIPDPQAQLADDISPTTRAATAGRADDSAAISPLPLPIPWRIRSLRAGCYLVKYTPIRSLFHYDGTIRVERSGFFATTASGDLYIHFPFILPWPGFPVPGPVTPPEPSPSAGIPIFPRSRYRYYLRIVQILEGLTLGNSFTLGFEMHLYNRTSKTWSNQGTFTAVMSWTPGPTNYPSSSDYLEGDVKNSSGTVVGRLTMGWVSSYLRKATIETDRVAQSEYPGNNGLGMDWQDAFDQVGWEVNAYESDMNLSEPSGQSWSNSELHARMVAKKDSANFDTEWRYHLLAVRRLDATSRGIMYDAGGTDSNNLPREGAAISSHWVIPNEAQWGTVQGVRFGAANAPYFRTAVHELGHAMGLRHNTADNGFMNTTGVIAGNPGTFPSNIQWSFNSEDARKLRHMPDAWVRPGEIPWAPSYSDPISPLDEAVPIEGLNLNVSPLLGCVPIGAPVRVNIELDNSTEMDLPVPSSLSLTSDHVSGRVLGPNGVARTFRSIFRCIEEDDLAPLKAKGQKRHALTLLRGAQGALFPAPGNYDIEVQVKWEISGVPVCATGRTAVMVTPPVDDAHASAAHQALSEPDTLLVLAIGGDHLQEGIAAIRTCLKNAVLRPHYGVIEAKRIGKRFERRAADVNGACALVDQDTVMSSAEVKRMAELVQESQPESRQQGSIASVISVLKAKADEVGAAEDVCSLVRSL